MYLTRTQLYELVWSRPIIAIAKEFGYSDVGFAKMCRKNKIPLPPRGYWARVNSGAKSPIPPLTLSHKDTPIYITSRPTITDEDISQRKAFLEKTKSELIETGQIDVPQQVTKPHKFTKNTFSYFEKLINQIEKSKKSKSLPSNYMALMRSIYRGRLVCHQADCFQVTASENLITRALIFLDVLTKELEIRSFKVSSISDQKSSYFIAAIKENEQIRFKIAEGYKYQKNEIDPKKMSELEKILYLRRIPVATGKLTLSICAQDTRISKSWTDGKRLIEVELPSIIHEFEKLVPLQKKRGIEQAILDEKRKEEVKLFRERESKLHQDNKLYEEILREAQSFRIHKDLEDYLNHLETKFLEENANFSEPVISWFNSVRSVALSHYVVKKRLKYLYSLSV